MNQVVRSLADRLEALLVEEREEALLRSGSGSRWGRGGGRASLHGNSTRGSSRPAMARRSMARRCSGASGGNTHNRRHVSPSLHAARDLRQLVQNAPLSRRRGQGLDRHAGITNAYAWASQSRPRGSSGGFWPSAAPGLSRNPRQSRSACRIFRDSARRAVADFATSRFLMSQILRHPPRNVADSATVADERTHGIDERTQDSDERTRLPDERTRPPTNEPGASQPLDPKSVFSHRGGRTGDRANPK